MAQDRHLSETRYFALLKSIHDKGGVECQRLPELFFPEDIPDPEKRELSIKAAKKICKRCPIMTECLTYALESNQRWGVWGGTEGHERI